MLFFQFTKVLLRNFTSLVTAVLIELAVQMPLGSEEGCVTHITSVA